MKPNRYIKAMEIGLAHEQEGISYFDLVNELQKQLKFKFGVESELTFLIWFSENFRKSNKNLESKDINDYRLYQKMIRGSKIYDHQKGTAKLIERNLSYKYWLNGNAVKQYLDYLEYKSARKSSRNAQIAAIISILIAAASFYFTYQATKETPRPPYEVKVIENNANTKELEQVKERLYKAELMLEAQVSDSISN